MPNPKPKLARYAPQLEEWLDIDQISLRAAQKRLKAKGCTVDVLGLRQWWRNYRAGRLERELLAVISRSAKQGKILKQALAGEATPEVELLINLHRSLILKLSTEGQETPALLRQASELLKPILTWASLLERRRILELAEEKYRDQVAARKAAIEHEINAAKNSGGISPETLERVERELKLL